jgi:hypothetical protein
VVKSPCQISGAGTDRAKERPGAQTPMVAQSRKSPSWAGMAAGYAAGALPGYLGVRPWTRMTPSLLVLVDLTPAAHADLVPGTAAML